MSGNQNVLFEVRDNIAFISLNRPESLNVLNLELVEELAEAALRCDGDEEIRAVVLSGAGRSFCAGGDLKTFVGQRSAMARYIKEVTTHLHTAISRFARMDPPVIAAVHGAVAGGGMSLACACDLMIAAESSRFTMAYTRIGLSPDGSSSYFLPRIVGQRRALELILTNRLLSAAEAMDWGIVNRVVSDADLMKEATALAQTLAAGPTAAFGASKRLLQAGWTESLETQMAEESRVISDMANAPHGREGITAFLEKRRPVFH